MINRVYFFVLGLLLLHQICFSLNGQESKNEKNFFFIPFYKAGIGKVPWIDGDYAKIGAFVGIPHRANLWIFQGDFLSIEPDKWVGSFGTGMRFYKGVSLGCNVFYDHLQDNLDHFHQLSIGCEALFINDFRIRTNIYIPLSSESRGNVNLYVYPANYQASCYEIESQAFAFTTEVARSFHIFADIKGCWGVSPYFLYVSNQSYLGLGLRGSLNYQQLISLEIISTHDHAYGTLVQGSIILSIPLRRFKKHHQIKPILIERFDSIVLKKCAHWHWNW